jgi:anionic cell wall polymer biosynthesis LytR-Cps2A-Psr (LCP) family protein
LLALTIEHNFGIQAEHYVVVNMQSFVRIVDAMGGIDINLPYTVDGRVKGSRDPVLYYAAGQQHLDGYRTLLLARLRPEGDFLRSQTQNLILQAIAAKMLTSESLPLLPGLIAASISSIQTDLREVEIAQLTCLATMLDAQNVNGFNFPENLFKGTRVDDPVLGRPFVWQVDFNILRSYLEYFKNGTWPETELTPP